MSTTPRNIKCEACGRGPSFAKDTRLERTGVCTPCAQRREGDNFTKALIQRGAEWAAAQDKAFLNENDDVRHAAEAEARASKDATAWALAKYVGTDQTTAMEMILAALDEVSA